MVWIGECPRRADTAGRGTPLSSICDASVCLNKCRELPLGFGIFKRLKRADTLRLSLSPDVDAPAPQSRVVQMGDDNRGPAPWVRPRLIGRDSQHSLWDRPHQSTERDLLAKCRLCASGRILGNPLQRSARVRESPT